MHINFGNKRAKLFWHQNWGGHEIVKYLTSMVLSYCLQSRMSTNCVKLLLLSEPHNIFSDQTHDLSKEARQHLSFIQLITVSISDIPQSDQDMMNQCQTSQQFSPQFIYPFIDSSQENKHTDILKQYNNIIIYLVPVKRNSNVTRQSKVRKFIRQDNAS